MLGQERAPGSAVVGFKEFLPPPAVVGAQFAAGQLCWYRPVLQTSKAQLYFVVCTAQFFPHPLFLAGSGS